MKKIAFAGGIVCLVLSACAETTPPPNDPGTVAATPDAKTTCPLGMQGTQITVNDAPDGADVLFTTKRNLSELRQRVSAQAVIHGPGQHAGLGHNGVHSGARTHGLRLSEIEFPVHVTATNVDGGARIHVVPERHADVDKLQHEIRERAAKIIALGACPS